jgi:hypothetical protein
MKNGLMTQNQSALPLELCIVTAEAHTLMVRLTTQSKGVHQETTEGAPV